MSIEEIKDRIFGKTKKCGPEESIYVVMRKFGYTLDEVMEMPLTTFQMILGYLKKEQEEMEKQANKARRKR